MHKPIEQNKKFKGILVVMDLLKDLKELKPNEVKSTVKDIKILNRGGK